MLINLLGFLILLLLTALFVWLAVRAWRYRRAFVKWSGLLFSGLMALLLGLVTIFTAKGLYMFYAPRNISISQQTPSGSADQIARGEHIAGYTCVNCHSQNDALPLSGGIDLNRESPIPVGSLIPYNLTPGGPLKDWSEGEIFRAVRYGVDKDGRPLITMGAMPFRNLSDEDILAVAAYLKNQPGVENDIQGGDHPNLLFALLAGAGLLPKLDPVRGVVTSPEEGPTAEYGKYIVSFIGCRDCHGKDLSGGTGGGFSPVGPNLRLVAGWSVDQFIQTIRTGSDPSGHALDSTKMHWKDYAHMDDIELRALYSYLLGLAKP